MMKRVWGSRGRGYLLERSGPVSITPSVRSQSLFFRSGGTGYRGTRNMKTILDNWYQSSISLSLFPNLLWFPCTPVPLYPLLFFQKIRKKRMGERIRAEKKKEGKTMKNENWGSKGQGLAQSSLIHPSYWRGPNFTKMCMYLHFTQLCTVRL